MNKLVIQTQYRENYAAHNEDFVPGVSQDHWKFKGGTTYVVPNFTDFTNVSEYVSKLEEYITYSNAGSEEYILTWNIVPHSEKVCEDWETITELFIDGDKATALKVTDNREDGYMKDDILELTESWTMAPANERLDYKAEYLMSDGDLVIGGEGLKEWYISYEAA